MAGLAGALALVAALALPGAAVAGGPTALGGDTAQARLRAADAALAWLAGRQQADGGFGAGASDWRSTTLAVEAFLALGQDAAGLSVGGKTPADYLAGIAGGVGSDAYQVAHMLLAGVALGHDPTAFAGRDWAAALQATLQPDGHFAGASADPVETQCSALLALRAAYLPAPAGALAWLKSAAQGDGGWGASPAGPSDTYHTGLALQALILAGEPGTSPTIQKAVAYLRARHLPDGGFGAAAGATQTDLLATSAAIRGLVAAGERLLDPVWVAGGWSAFDAVLALQDASGGFAAAPAAQPDIAAAVAGIQGLTGARGVPRQRLVAVKRALKWLHTQQNSDGTFGPPITNAGAVYAIAVGGENPAGPAWTPAGVSALTALAAGMTTLIGIPDPPDRSRPREAEAGKAAMAAVAAGANPRAFGGYDLVSRIEFYYNPATGRYHDTHLYRNDLAILGLAAAGAPIPPAARQALLAQQRADGGWGWASPTTFDIDTTGRTMEALVAAGQPPASPELDKAATFVASWQFADGSLPDRSIATAGNSNSTALALTGLLAAGRDPRRTPFVVVSPEGALVSMLDAALSFQEDSGAFVFTRAFAESRMMAVQDMVPALARPYPAYAPPATPTATQAGAAHVWRRAGLAWLVVPYAGDGNGNGALIVRTRAGAAGVWSDPLPMLRTPLAYLVPLGGSLAGLHGTDISVEFQDTDGVSGTAVQNLRLAPAALPLLLRGR